MRGRTSAWSIPPIVVPRSGEPGVNRDRGRGLMTPYGSRESKSPVNRNDLTGRGVGTAPSRGGPTRLGLIRHNACEGSAGGKVVLTFVGSPRPVRRDKSDPLT